ncbi:MAG: hypothetical protein ACRC4Q_04550, partial [Paraclostridium dentum]
LFDPASPAALWGSDLVTELDQPSLRVFQQIRFSPDNSYTTQGIIGVIVLLQNEGIPNQSLP